MCHNDEDGQQLVLTRSLQVKLSCQIHGCSLSGGAVRSFHCRLAHPIAPTIHVHVYSTRLHHKRCRPHNRCTVINMLIPDRRLSFLCDFRRRRRRHRVASSCRRVAPPWPRRMACLQRFEGSGTDSVSLRIWSVQRARGRPGQRLQSPPSKRPDARPTWQCRALCDFRRRQTMSSQRRQSSAKNAVNLITSVCIGADSLLLAQYIDQPCVADVMNDGAGENRTEGHDSVSGGTVTCTRCE